MKLWIILLTLIKISLVISQYARKFKITRNLLINADASLANNATFIKAIERDNIPVADCRIMCARRAVCDTFVLERPRGRETKDTCFLFNCGLEICEDNECQNFCLLDSNHPDFVTGQLILPQIKNKGHSKPKHHEKLTTASKEERIKETTPLPPTTARSRHAENSQNSVPKMESSNEELMDDIYSSDLDPDLYIETIRALKNLVEAGNTDDSAQSDVFSDDYPIKETDVCKMNADIGPCRSLLPRFYFDAETQSCEQFFFGGCRGNDNKFMTAEDCKRRCLGKFSENPIPEKKAHNEEPIEWESHHHTEDTDVNIKAKPGLYLDRGTTTHKNPAEESSNFFLDSIFTSQMPSKLSKLRMSALVPLIIGVCFSMLLLMYITVRCVINRRHGAFKFRKFITENDEDYLINGMYL